MTVIGLGVNSGDISVNALNSIKSADHVLVQTKKTLSAGFLAENGIDCVYLDDVYDRSRNFDTLEKNLLSKVKSYLKSGNVCFLVDGAVSENICAKSLIAKYKDAVVFEGASKVHYAMDMCGVISDDYTAVSAYSLDGFTRYSFPLVIYDLDSRILASEWKLKLFKIVGEETEVALYIDNQPKRLPLYMLDGEDGFDYSTVLIIGDRPIKDKTRFDIYDLMEILRILRRPDGCPWDRVQTPQSIRKNLVEESYELIDAIDKWDDDKMKEETGDMFMQVAFHTLFAEERGAYTLEDVLSGVCEKLVFRHTHVFGDDKAADAQSALNIWNKNKQIEKGYTSAAAYVDDVPKCLPALLRCGKVVSRAKKSNFDPFDKEKVKKEIEIILSDEKTYKQNGGRLLFLVTWLLKCFDTDPEEQLADEVKTFIERMRSIETKLSDSGETLENVDKDRITKLYDET